MSLQRIWKTHEFPFGKRKGQQALFEVKPRAKDGLYCVKPANEPRNGDEFYTKVRTLDEVADYTKKGWRVRMRCEEIGEWNTLKSEGLNYA